MLSQAARSFAATLVAFALVTALPGLAGDPEAGELLSLRETLSASAFHDGRTGPVRIAGATSNAGVLLRVTTSAGNSSTARVSSVAGRFDCRYPEDFPGAPNLAPGLLFIDATTDADFNAQRPGHFQAEAAMIVQGIAFGRDGVQRAVGRLAAGL